MSIIIKLEEKATEVEICQIVFTPEQLALENKKKGRSKVMNFYSFYTGRSFDAHEWLGVHPQGDGFIFRTFAPGAERISLIGDCTGGAEIPMEKAYDGNFFECFLPDAKEGDCYEYRIYHNGQYTDHCDPYGFGMELRPAHRSIVRTLSYDFHDENWMKTRNDRRNGPLNIYEMHLGSWRRKGDGLNDFYTYEELADLLIPYIKQSGYDYIEMLPICEHPADESWGYQNTGFFSPTSRYGTGIQLKKFIDTCHQNGIGVILDFVPVHFAMDDYGLHKYDGSFLYEYPSNDVGVSEWGSCNFMHSRGEVRSFLQSAVCYWLGEYHFDGIRFDAISRILYWQGDPARGVNGMAVNFVREMNRGIKERFPGCMLIAEDSTDFDKVTEPTDQGGLGYDYKWDMGWMHDTLSVFQMPPHERMEQYNKLTFSMMYFYNDRFLLPFSHDEVVHGKATILQKMNGDYDRKFPQARALYLYMMTHPGKKLNFMGNEIGHFREWDEKREQDWELLTFPIHDAFYHYIMELNQLYHAHPGLYEWDYEPAGFHWLDCEKDGSCTYAFLRISHSEKLLVVLNLNDHPVVDYEINVIGANHLELLLHSDWQCWGGQTVQKSDTKIHRSGNRFLLDLPPLSGMLFQVQF